VCEILESVVRDIIGMDWRVNEQRINSVQGSFCMSTEKHMWRLGNDDDMYAMSSLVDQSLPDFGDLRRLAI
jgi:hypothetical protein